MNLKKPRRQARLFFALGIAFVVVGFLSFRGSGFNNTAARFVCVFVFASSTIWLAIIEHLFSRKARRAAMRAERKAAEQGKIMVGMSRPKRVRSRVWQERKTVMQKNSETQPADETPVVIADEHASEIELNALVEGAFNNTDYDDGFILWEGPQRPPKGGKLTTITDSDGGTAGYEQLSVATPDPNTACGFVFTAPDNASARATAETARLKSEYE